MIEEVINHNEQIEATFQEYGMLETEVQSTTDLLPDVLTAVKGTNTLLLLLIVFLLLIYIYKLFSNLILTFIR